MISARSISSLTRFNTKRARWSLATKSPTVGGRNSGSSIFQARNVLLMRRQNLTRPSLASKIRLLLGQAPRARFDLMETETRSSFLSWSHFLRKTDIHPRVKPEGRLFPENALI